MGYIIAGGLFPFIGWCLRRVLTLRALQWTTLGFFLFSVIIVAIAHFGISTRWDAADDLLATTPLLAISCFFWTLIRPNDRWLTVVGFMGLGCAFVCTLGLLIIGLFVFAFGMREPDRIIALDGQLELREQWTGHMTTEGGYRVDVVQRYPWFPGLERDIAFLSCTEDEVPPRNSVSVRFDPSERTVYLSSGPAGSWQRTMHLER